MYNNIENLRNGILESFQDIDYDRYVDNKICKHKLNKAYSLVRSFIVESYDDNDLSDEAIRYMSVIERYVTEKKLFNKQLYEGFYNPFDDIDDVETVKPIKHFTVNPEEKSVRISKIEVWNTDVKDKVYFDGGKMIAGQFFGKGDTVEVCPVRLIYDSDLYSKNIRDIAFSIDPAKRIYGIPFGYASYYRNSKDVTLDGNADYEFIPSDTPSIKIYVTSNIKKGEEIILHATDDDFQNEIKPGQFQYDKNGDEPYMVVKNYRVL